MVIVFLSYVCCLLYDSLCFFRLILCLLVLPYIFFFAFFVVFMVCVFFFFFCKQKTAYEMRISDWSSDVCSSDLAVWSFVQPSLIYGDVIASIPAAERPQTDFETQSLLSEINGLVSGDIEAAFDPRAEQGAEVYRASQSRWSLVALGDRKSTRLNSSH